MIFGGERPERRSLIGSKRRKGSTAEAGLESVPIQRSEKRTRDTRDGDRHRLTGEQVALTHDGRRIEVELINLSGGGAMVAGVFKPMMWDRVDLHLGEEGTVECVVRWLRDDRVGLEFAHETRLDCSPEERVALLRDVLARSFPEAEIAIAAPERPAPAEPPKGDDDHRRGEPRHPLIWSGQIHHNHESTQVRLRNISARGALIECAVPLPVGAEPLLDLGDGGSVFASVTWCRGDQIGLKFSEPFDMSRLASTKPDVAPTSWKQPDYLRSGPAPSSPWAPQWKRLSLSELNEELEGFLKR